MSHGAPKHWGIGGPGGHWFWRSRQLNRDLSLSARVPVVCSLAWQCPTFPGACAPSILGAGGLHRRVRDGYGCFPSAMTARPAGACPRFPAQASLSSPCSCVFILAWLLKKSAPDKPFHMNLALSLASCEVLTSCKRRRFFW